METALANGNEDAAQTAADELKAALANASDALKGVISQQLANAKSPKNARQVSGSGPGRPYAPVDVNNIPWQSQGMQDFYQNNFANCWDSGVTPNDSEATPE